MKNETLIPSMSLRFVERDVAGEVVLDGVYKYDRVRVLQQRFTRPGSYSALWLDVPLAVESCDGEPE